MLAILFFCGFVLVAKYRVYQKMGIPGWKSAVPIVNIWTMMKALYGSGWIIFVPVYGQLILLFGHHFKLAKRFDLPKSFGFGLLVLNPIFMIMLAYNDVQYLRGGYAISSTDFFSRLGDKIDAWVKGRNKTNGAKNAVTALKTLGELHANGQIDEEAFTAKKAELMKRI